jgi:trk system potassium uptake protein
MNNEQLALINAKKGKRMARKKSKQEFAVIGLGRLGSAVARTLLERGRTVLGIDRDRNAVQLLADELTEALILDATDEDALRSVDIALYDAVIVAISDNFEDELLATLTLKQLGVRRVVGVASDERQRTILLKVGADEVVMPEEDTGRRMGLLLALPNLVERLTLGKEHSIAELHTPKAFTDRTVQQIDLSATHHVTLLAIKRKTDLIMPPPPDFLLWSDDLMVVIGKDEDVRRIAEVE